MLLLVVIALLLACAPVFGQERGPYYVSIHRELPYGAASAGTLALGEVLRARRPDVVLTDLHLGRIPSFDRVATRNHSTSAIGASDGLAYTATALPLLLLVGDQPRSDMWKLGLLYAETMTLNLGITNIIKATALRPRPYVYDDNLSPDTVIGGADRASFLSAHTSNSAAAGFFFARVFSDYYPESNLKPYVWILGAGLPVATGYLRIRAGQHYPSDVAAGYVLGAAIGYAVPALHRKPTKTSGLTCLPTGHGVYLVYRL